MTDRQDAQVDMYQEVDRFFISYVEKVAKDAILKNHSDQFHINVLAIAKFMQAQEFDSKGYAVQKKKSKEDLSELTFNLSSGFCSFAVDTDNQPVLKEFDLSLSIIKRLSDAEFVNHNNRLIASLSEYIKELKPYHITAEELVNLTNKSKAYTDILHTPDEVIKNKAIATDKIKELITVCRDLLENSIDRDMNYYKDKDEPFYLEYEKRREIHDAATHALSIKGKVTDAHYPDQPVQYVQVTVKFHPGSELSGNVKSSYTTTTTALGNFQFNNLPEGDCRVKFERNNYRTLELNSEVHTGDCTKLDVLFAKEEV